MLDLRLGVAAVLALTCASCASTGQKSIYQQELEQLEKDCLARGGIIRPTGVSTGRPQTEYLCNITNGSRITSG